MKKYFFAIALCAIMVAACNKEQEVQTPVVQTVTLSATGEAYSEVDLNGEATKGTLSLNSSETAYDFLWASGDQIGVRVYKGTTYNGKDEGSQYKAKDVDFNLNSGFDGSASGSFTSAENLDEWHHWGYAAFYPKFDSNVGGDGMVYFHLWPWHDTYLYTSGTCLMPMVANLNIAPEGLEGRPSDIQLKHIGAGLRVTLKDVPADANQVSLTVPGKKICGWFSVDPSKAGDDEDGIIVATNSEDISEQTLYLKFAKVTEKCDMTFIFPLPTVDLSGGITLKLYYDGGETDPTEFWSRSASNLTGCVLNRGQILDMPDITIPIIPSEKDDVIWIDGKTKDWSDVTNVFTTESSRIKEWKYTFDDNYIYFLYKIDASKIQFNKDSGSYDWKSYIYIGFDTDSTTGYTNPANKDNTGGTGDGMDALAVVFPWRGTTEGSPQCLIGIDGNGHIEKPVGTTLDNHKLKVGGKISGGYCYVEVRVPLTDIGITTTKDYIIVNHAMDFYPTGAQMIAIAGPLPGVITATNQTVEVGKTINIGASTNSTAAITYSSDDESIATVDDKGVITGVAQGSTTITLNVEAVPGKYTAASKIINVTVEESYTPAIVIDGVFSDWTTPQEGVTINSFENDFGNGTSNANRIPRWKVTSDAKSIFFYFEIGSEKITSVDYSYIYTGLDINNDNQGEYTIPEGIGGNYEVQLYFYPFVLGSNPVVCSSTSNGSLYYNGSSVGQVNVNGKIDGNAYVEISIPRNLIGSPGSNVQVRVNHSYQGYPVSTNGQEHTFTLK